MALRKPFPIQNASISFGADQDYGKNQDTIGVGAMGVNDHKIVARGTPAMAVVAGSGYAYVPFGTAAAIGQAGGLRRCFNDANSDSGTAGSLNSTDWLASFATADATNPRIDSVYLVVRDSSLDSSGAQDSKYQVVGGTATSGATLDNRTGAGSAPNSGNAILLADVLIAANATTVTNSVIRDRRPLAPEITPVVFPLSSSQPAGVDQVPLMPTPGIQISGTVPTDTTTPLGMLGVTLAQAAVAVYLPRRIVAATKIHWAYEQPASALTTTGWTLGVYDASGRQIITTATAGTAFTGSLATVTQVAAAWQGGVAVTFEEGVYWLVYGQTFGSGTASGVKALCANVGVGSTAGAAAPAPGPNMFAYSATGGVTLPTTIYSFTDAAATSPGAVRYGVPVCSLSVG